MHVWKMEGMRMNPKWGYCDYRLVDIYTLTEVRYRHGGIFKIYQNYRNKYTAYDSLYILEQCTSR